MSNKTLTRRNKVYVVILNWNGWQDTIACLQSLSSTKGVEYSVVVCDNGSTDGSVKHISAWAEGKLKVAKPEHPRLEALMHGKVARDKNWLTLIENKANLGFAAGNNPGIRYAMNQPDMTHVWLLNNDTLVEPDCLLKMLRRLEKEPEPAICGSRIMFYDNPGIVQALGGNSFNKWTGNARESIGRFRSESDPRDPEEAEKELDYVSGCSMLIPREFIDDIGLMEERYFLYYEEIDWAVRARRKYKSIYADDAVLYHKEGSSIGSASLKRRPALLSEFYCFRNKLLFTRAHFPQYLLSCYFTTALQVLNRWRRGYWASGWLILKVLLGKKEFSA